MGGSTVIYGTYLFSNLVKTKCSFKHLFQESVVVLVSSLSLYNFIDDSFFIVAPKFFLC